MPPIKIVEDQLNLVPSKDFKFAKFGFDNFNPVQSRIFEHYQEDANALIASSTSSGKTVIAEMVISYNLREHKKKAMYLVPYKSLAQEKYDEWTDSNHHFHDLNVVICTGDYKLTSDRKKELDNADIIIMSSEMLNHRVRNNQSEKNKFLLELGVLVCDEFHNIGDPSRGHHLEAAMMKFTQINKDCKLVLLSATLPNVEEIAEWTSYILNKKNTILIKSNFRPCPLTIHYEYYDDDGGSYLAKENEKIAVALDIMDYYPDDKFLIFAHTKNIGHLIKKHLNEEGIPAEFHNADLSKEKRLKIENDFKNGKLRVIIATSTVAAGVNLPARRVIVLGVHRGTDEVSALDIIQECGRAGRPKYDASGDAYVLLPKKDFLYHKTRLKTPINIKSQMLDNIGGMHKNLCFHLVSEINNESISNKEDIKNWYKRSLASFQSCNIDEGIISGVIDLLKKFGIIWENEDGSIVVTSIGKISSLFYYSPFDVANLKRNFNEIFKNNWEKDDYLVSFSLGNIDTYKMGIVNKNEREAMSKYYNKISEIFGSDNLRDSAVKTGYAYYCLINGIHNEYLSGSMRQIQFDFPRTNQVLQAIDSFSGKWGKKDWFEELNMRISYGVKPELIPLCKLPNIGKIRSQKLFNSGFKDCQAILSNPEKAKKILGFKDDIMNKLIVEINKNLLDL